MSKVYFIGDLHFGHKGILNIRNEFKSSAEHDQFIVDTWNGKVKKNDLVYVMGDVALSKEGLERCRELVGRKILVKGNHDEEDIHRYLVFFENIVALHKYKDETGRYWLSHAPIHPVELRGRDNIHGHTHHRGMVKTVYGQNGEEQDWESDWRYLNTSCEYIGYEPKTTKELLAQQKKNNEIKEATSLSPADPIEIEAASILGAPLPTWHKSTSVAATTVSFSAEPGNIPQ